jgi:penicillin-binding protein-related factor A (putative recombinase)
MGLIQKSFGDSFERLFHFQCCRTKGLAITRFPDGCKVLRQNKIVRVKTPWDWIVSYNGKTALIDTKTTEGDTFPNSKIEHHQVSEMYSHSIAGNNNSGYVIWFRESDGVYFASSIILNNLLKVRGSLKPEILQFLGKSRDFKPQIMFGNIE